MNRFISITKPLTWLMAILLAALAAGCGSGSTDPILGGGGSVEQADAIRPFVTVTVPAASAVIATNVMITATFSEDMAPATIDSVSFTLTCESPCVSPTGNTVSYAVGGKTATFAPGADLEPSTGYTATITTAATDLAGNELAGNQAPWPAASNHVWTFTTGAGQDITAPTVTLTNPADLDTDVALNSSINATFSEAMNQATIDATTFTVQASGVPATIVGEYSYDSVSNIATFTPSSNLEPDTDYVATITTAATDLATIPLASDYVWTFKTGAGLAPSAVVLGKAASFGMAATAGITSTTTTTTINGDVVVTATPTCNAVAAPGGVGSAGFGVSGTACGGVPQTPVLTGSVITPSYPDTTTANAIVNDLKAAFLSITPTAGPPAAGSLDGATTLSDGTTLGEPTGAALVQGDNYFVAGVYQSLTSIMITGDLTLDAQGDPNASFIFQSSSTTGTAAGTAPPAVGHTRILLINGAKASNVWWQVASSATLGLYSEFQGNILASETIVMNTGATSCGRLFAGAFSDGQFTFDGNVVSVPGQPFAPPATYSTTCQ